MPFVYLVFADGELDGLFGSAAKALARLAEYGAAEPGLDGWPPDLDAPLTDGELIARLRAGRHLSWRQDLSAIRWTVQ